MNKYFLTYCFSDTPRKNRFSIIVAADEASARSQVFSAIGSYWAFMYTEEEFAGQPEKFNLVEIKLGETR